MLVLFVDSVGRRTLQVADAFQRRLPIVTSKMWASHPHFPRKNRISCCSYQT